MKLTILNAAMTRNKEDGNVGHVSFQVENHKKDYEITLQSKHGKDWSYALNFLNESGSEDDILAVEEELDKNDELFEQLVQAAKNNLVIE